KLLDCLDLVKYWVRKIFCNIYEKSNQEHNPLSQFSYFSVNYQQILIIGDAMLSICEKELFYQKIFNTQVKGCLLNQYMCLGQLQHYKSNHNLDIELYIKNGPFPENKIIY